ncbi:hypothetical protein GN956_G24100 [Arapaima gigas]
MLGKQSTFNPVNKQDLYGKQTHTTAEKTPPQPTTIIQQLPHQQPLMAQVLPPPAFPPSKSRSIKEDMVELMLMQNVQMHQIIMHSMMLKAMPPMTFPPVGGASQVSPAFQSTAHPGQESYQGAPVIVRTEKSRGSSVHHHHHYSTAATQPPPIGYSMWPPAMPSLKRERTPEPVVHQVKTPITLPPLHM